VGWGDQKIAMDAFHLQTVLPYRLKMRSAGDKNHLLAFLTKKPAIISSHSTATHDGYSHTLSLHQICVGIICEN
jgi:hypothetical protein